MASPPSSGRAMSSATENASSPPQATHSKLHGRAFYDSIGSPKFIVAPMVDQSEFAWRMLTRSFLPEPQRSSILAYSPMLHARLYAETPKYRDSHFQPARLEKSSDTSSSTIAKPYLDGNPKVDRPLFVQFCANDPTALLSAAQLVAPYCDAVDLNLGCPQGIARKGHYGAFLQEDQQLIFNLINNLHRNLSVPVTAKIRILDTKEETLAYAQNVLKAGASILTVHGRRREQKGHLTGMADWEMIKFLRGSLPPETVLFANGNILQPGDLDKCLEATGADGVMSAEGNLSDPAIFGAAPEVGQEGREYWRAKDGRGGWRVDAVVRRYFDIMHRYVLGGEPPVRRPLFVPGDDAAWVEAMDDAETEEPAKKRQKKDKLKKERISTSPNMIGMRPHLFHLLRHFVSEHHDVRDMLARTAIGDMAAFEKVLEAVEYKVAKGLLEYERTEGKSIEQLDDKDAKESSNQEGELDSESSLQTVKNCKRPWWVVQPIVRPLPKEALAKGAIALSKKDKAKLKKDSEMQVSNAATPAAGVSEEAPQSTVQSLEKTTSYPSSELVSG